MQRIICPHNELYISWTFADQVRALEFSPIAVHLLASGGADGELRIWDVTNPSSPTDYPAASVSCCGSILQPLFCKLFCVCKLYAKLVTLWRQEAPSSRHKYTWGMMAGKTRQHRGNLRMCMSAGGHKARVLAWHHKPGVELQGATYSGHLH